MPGVNVDPSVGLIGLGTMGAPMAQHIRRAGYALTVWARSADAAADIVGRGADLARTPAEVGERCDIVVLMVPGESEIDVILGQPGGLLESSGSQGPSSRILVICSTVGAGYVQALQARPEVRERGWRAVDAPVSGGREGAEAGALSILVGGDPEDTAAVAPVLAAFGNPVRLGGLGSGEVAKACNQLIVAATLAGLSEALVLAEKSGLDLVALCDILGGGYAGSRLLEVKKAKFIAHDHRPMGAAKYMVKDLRSVMDQSTATGTVLPLAQHLLASFTDLVESGLGDLDTTVLQEWVLSRSGASAARKAPAQQGSSS